MDKIREKGYNLTRAQYRDGVWYVNSLPTDYTTAELFHEIMKELGNDESVYHQFFEQ